METWDSEYFTGIRWLWNWDGVRHGSLEVRMLFSLIVLPRAGTKCNGTVLDSTVLLNCRCVLSFSFLAHVKSVIKVLPEVITRGMLWKARASEVPLALRWQ